MDNDSALRPVYEDRWEIPAWGATDEVVGSRDDEEDKYQYDLVTNRRTFQEDYDHDHGFVLGSGEGDKVCDCGCKASTLAQYIIQLLVDQSPEATDKILNMLQQWRKEEIKGSAEKPLKKIANDFKESSSIADIELASDMIEMLNDTDSPAQNLNPDEAKKFLDNFEYIKEKAVRIEKKNAKPVPAPAPANNEMEDVDFNLDIYDESSTPAAPVKEFIDLDFDLDRGDIPDI